MRKTDFDTRLIIYRARQVFIVFSVILATAGFTLMLIANDKLKQSWIAVALPITGIGLLFLLISKTEEWEYKAWQGKPRKIEQQER